MFQQTRLRSLTLLLCLAALAIYAAFGGYYAGEVVLEIATLGLLAIALDLVAGFGGMQSLMHGALMGLGAYGYAIASVKFGINPWLATLLGVALPTVYGAVVGFITARALGIFFIMATLAFGQMAYTVIYQARWLGGDDGLRGLPRMSASWLGLDLNGSLAFACFALLVLAVGYGLAALLLRSGFGRMLEGLHANEERLGALGVDTRRIKTLAMAFSSFLAGLAGVVVAQHAKFVSPELLFWTVSGEALIIVILGGAGTLMGPLVGAICFVGLKHEVSRFTSHWPLFIGLLLIATVLLGGRGLFGEAEAWLKRRHHA